MGSSKEPNVYQKVNIGDLVYEDVKKQISV